MAKDGVVPLTGRGAGRPGDDITEWRRSYESVVGQCRGTGYAPPTFARCKLGRTVSLKAPELVPGKPWKPDLHWACDCPRGRGRICFWQKAEPELGQERAAPELDEGGALLHGRGSGRKRFMKDYEARMQSAASGGAGVSAPASAGGHPAGDGLSEAGRTAATSGYTEEDLLDDPDMFDRTSCFYCGVPAIGVREAAAKPEAAAAARAAAATAPAAASAGSPLLLSFRANPAASTGADHPNSGRRLRVGKAPLLAMQSSPPPRPPVGLMEVASQVPRRFDAPLKGGSPSGIRRLRGHQDEGGPPPPTSSSAVGPTPSSLGLSSLYPGSAGKRRIPPPRLYKDPLSRLRRPSELSKDPPGNAPARKRRRKFPIIDTDVEEVESQETAAEMLEQETEGGQSAHSQPQPAEARAAFEPEDEMGDEGAEPEVAAQPAQATVSPAQAWAAARQRVLSLPPRQRVLSLQRVLNRQAAKRGSVLASQDLGQGGARKRPRTWESVSESRQQKEGVAESDSQEERLIELAMKCSQEEPIPGTEENEEDERDLHEALQRSLEESEPRVPVEMEQEDRAAAMVESSQEVEVVAESASQERAMINKATKPSLIAGTARKAWRNPAHAEDVDAVPQNLGMHPDEAEMRSLFGPSGGSSVGEAAVTGAEGGVFRQRRRLGEEILRQHRRKEGCRCKTLDDMALCLGM
jgi:hypothetical protein